ncbi:hypothetical protein J8I26_07545 [Herbaspirillum sp. LeCh32-8]|uniref:hypothetical protein n=1 Tax=Herbaspirillum sp. LeCh32-8 TaxID=2821356 RepID=UPI001AE8C83D|nr:hypothetical protein [Herbaspirillum sp. LeCh32-8]MBP0597947.1 hypothetical protein [Herbaspirillum sp. LeCh32-8]
MTALIAITAQYIEANSLLFINLLASMLLLAHGLFQINKMDKSSNHAVRVFCYIEVASLAPPRHSEMPIQLGREQPLSPISPDEAWGLFSGVGRSWRW